MMTHYFFQVSSPGYDRQGVADHANNLASKIPNNMIDLLKGLRVDLLAGVGFIVNECKVSKGINT